MRLVSKDGNIHGRKIGDQNIEVGGSPVEVDDDLVEAFMNMTSGLVEIVPGSPKKWGEAEEHISSSEVKSRSKAKAVVVEDDLPVYQKEDKPKAKTKGKK